MKKTHRPYLGEYKWKIQLMVCFGACLFTFFLARFRSFALCVLYSRLLWILINHPIHPSRLVTRRGLKGRESEEPSGENSVDSRHCAGRADEGDIGHSILRKQDGA